MGKGREKRSKHVAVANQIVFLDDKPKSSGPTQNQEDDPFKSDAEPIDISDDDLPF